MACLADDNTMALSEGSAFLSLDEYTVDERPFAHGSNAAIYKAELSLSDGNRPKEIVLKVITPPASVVDHLALLEEEVKILSAVQGHPSILGFYGVCLMERAFQGNTSWAIQMEHCSGGDLWHATSRKPYLESEARDAMNGIFAGLTHMHELGFVHRDVKPENVLVTAAGIVKLADFGISARLTDQVAMKKRCGSPGYAAPEIFLGKDYDIKIDTFSCGSVLYFMFIGKTPFSGANLQEVIRKTVKSSLNFRRSVRLERLSASCKALMSILLSKDPCDRPTAKEALELAWLNGSDVEDARDSLRGLPKLHTMDRRPLCDTDAIMSRSSTSQATSFRESDEAKGDTRSVVTPPSCRKSVHRPVQLERYVNACLSKGPDDTSAAMEALKLRWLKKSDMVVAVDSPHGSVKCRSMEQPSTHSTATTMSHLSTSQRLSYRETVATTDEPITFDSGGGGMAMEEGCLDFLTPVQKESAHQIFEDEMEMFSRELYPARPFKARQITSRPIPPPTRHFETPIGESNADESQSSKPRKSSLINRLRAMRFTV